MSRYQAFTWYRLHLGKTRRTYRTCVHDIQATYCLGLSYKCLQQLLYEQYLNVDIPVNVNEVNGN